MDNNELLDIDAPSGWGNTGEHSYIQRGRKATGAALVELANADGVIGDSNPLAVKVTGVVSLNSNAVALTVTDYIAVTNRAPDYAIDDSITVTRFYDTSTDPPTISSVNWYNNDESAQISTPPNMAHLQYSGEKALTLTQLQSLSLATEAKQDDLNALVGEAQENPTNPYSLLGSIKRLIAAVKTEIVLAAGNALIGTVSLNEKTVSGTITAQDETVDIDLTGFSNLSCQVTGTYAASALTLRLSNDNQNWTTSTALDTFSSQGAVSSSTITAGTTGLFNCSINGAKHARIIALGAITGTASIVLNAKNAKSPSSYIANITTLAGFTPFGTASSAVATAVDTSTPHRRLAALILHHQRLTNISPTKRLSECFVEKRNKL